jgi:outer membrane protein TolC
MKVVSFLLLAAMAAVPGFAAEWPRRPAVVEALIDQAMKANLTLQSQGVDVEIGMERLREARSYYQPKLDFTARYSRAEGGRTIDLPVGDLLNPAYDALNQLSAAQGGQGGFSHVSNQSIDLLRGREQETKLTLVQPLYRPEITRGVKARRADWESREAQLAAYRRELRLQVETGYYRWAQTEMVAKILESAASVTTEALRVNRSLFSVDKITEDRVLRAEADDLEIQQQRLEAERDRKLALAYLNFLLNRPLDTQLTSPTNGELANYVHSVTGISLQSTPLIDRREELLALTKAIDAAAAAEGVERARRYPTLAFAAEGGVQGENYRTGHGYNYGMASLIAQVNVWDGKALSSRQRQARLERSKLELQLERARQQMALDAERSIDELRAAIAACQTAERRREASARVFEIVNRREREGLASQLSFLDARSEFTRAELNLEVVRQRLLIAVAALDRATAATPLP